MYAVGGRCYLLNLKEKFHSWDEAFVACRRRGSELVSLNTAEEWKAIMRLLSLRDYSNEFHSVYLGLHRARQLLPEM